MKIGLQSIFKESKCVLERHVENVTESAVDKVALVVEAIAELVEVCAQFLVI